MRMNHVSETYLQHLWPTWGKLQPSLGVHYIPIERINKTLHHTLGFKGGSQQKTTYCFFHAGPQLITWFSFVFLPIFTLTSYNSAISTNMSYFQIVCWHYIVGGFSAPSDTTHYPHNPVNCLPLPSLHKRYLIAHMWGMWCHLWVKILTYILPHSLRNMIY